MHWINFPLLVVMIYSGLLIYWADSQHEGLNAQEDAKGASVKMKPMGIREHTHDGVPGLLLTMADELQAASTLYAKLAKALFAMFTLSC
jgi:hypothetical protein